MTMNIPGIFKGFNEIVSLCPAVFAKILARFLSVTNGYEFLFSNIHSSAEMEYLNLKNRKFERLPDCHIYTDMTASNLYSVFTRKMTLQNLMDSASNDRPFWKTTWRNTDPKFFWEMARGWQWLSAYAGSNTEDEQQVILQNIRNWLALNQYPNGLAWAMELDVAIRAINLYLIVLYSGTTIFNASLYQHYTYLAKMLWHSRYGARNNHYLGELTAVAILATFFKDTKATEYKKQLTEEFCNQFYDDGINVEQSIRYHFFSLQFAVIAKLLLGIDMPFLKKAIDFLMANMLPDRTWPSIGDDDMGCVFRLNSEPVNGDYEALLSLAAVALQSPEFKYVAGTLSDEACLLIPRARNIWNNLEAQEPSRKFFFNNGGFVTYRNSWERGVSFISIKFGPHKWHAHADLFHITLCSGGKQVLIDSGTYRYNNVPEERRYFRSTRAHNTLEFCGEDQTRQLTTFRWWKAARVLEHHFDEDDEGFHFSAFHDGYSGKKAIHRRDVYWQKDLKSVRVADKLIGEGSGKTVIYWHFHPDIALSKAGNVFSMYHSGKVLGEILINSQYPLELNVIKTPVSFHYGQRSEKNTLAITLHKKPLDELEVQTEFKFG